MGSSGRWEPRRRARRRALQALYQWQMTGQEAGDIIQQFRETQDFGNVDAELFEALVRGVTQAHVELEERLRDVLDRPLHQCDVMERVVLLLGAWQLLHDSSLPMQVVIDESVELARRFGSEQSPKYVNGVLDRAARVWQHAAD